MIYENQKTKNISFPIGGIGTGCIGLGGNGELKDWEIFNRPNKSSRNGYSHFAIKANSGERVTTRVLHGDTTENLMGTPCASTGHYGIGYGPRKHSFAGFPHFKDVRFEGEFPMARLCFSDHDFPANVRLCAFNPLIPHEEDDSSLPVGFFEWEIENTSKGTVQFALACTVCNPAQATVNKMISVKGMNGVFLGSAGVEDTELGYSDLCVLTDHSDTDVQEYWYRGRFRDSVTTYWKNLSELDRMPKRSYSEAGVGDHGTVVSYVTLGAGERAKLRFVIAWNVPLAQNYWTPREEGEKPRTWRNYYATLFRNSLASARYAMENFDTLYEKTALFTKTLHESTLPSAVIDAVSANLSVLKTPTTLRLEDGSFWGWEGCSETVGSCFGTCQHVWNYAYAMPYLFPRLERSIRENTMKYALQECGATSFRIDLPPKREMATERACVDGQMGEVIKCYREWKMSGNDEWLRLHSERIFKMLEYAWSEENPDGWDADCDGVLEGRQHHTLDMELFGANSWLQGFYLLALDCGARMARYLGKTERAKQYEALYWYGKQWMKEHLFNGRYFCQSIDLTDRSIPDRFDASDRYWNDEAGEIKYQIGEGCIIDQMLADWHAALIGVDGVFDSAQKKTALQNLYQNNYKSSMREVTNMWRHFAVEDDAGTLICSYPEGVRVPAIPIPYCEETMTGFEYSLAGLMILEGLRSEGEQIVGAVRDRYDGENRNPWNEMECGSNYARSMASYALLPIYSGFTFDMTKQHIGFAPISGKGRYLFSVCESWGSVEFHGEHCRLSILGQPLKLRSLAIPSCDRITEITVDGVAVEFCRQNGALHFDEVNIEKEMCLR